jgi:hypothetical protein
MFMEAENLQIIYPVGMFGPEKDYLVDAIIRAVAEYHAIEGEWADKYGTTVDNCVFSMNPYCWCESEDCKWCGEENAPQFHYKPLDFKVWWYKYIGRGMDFNKDISIDECAKMLKDCIDIKSN